MIVYEARASTILYNLLRARGDDRPFLMPANVCPIVPITFLKAGRPFRLVDIEGRDLALDAERGLALVEAHPGAFGGLLYVRPYGARGDAEPFFRALKGRQPDLLVIDDRCLCRPDCAGASASPGADVTLFSTGRSKPADLGFGGFAQVARTVRYRRHRSRYSPAALAWVTRRYRTALAGRRAFRGGRGAWLDLAPPRLSWAGYRRRVLSTVGESVGHRRRLNAVYRHGLPAEIQLPPRFQGWRFNVVVPEPDALVARLFAAGLFASRHYPSLGGVFARGRFPVAERLHERVVNLFNDGHVDEGMAARTVRVVAAHLDAVARTRRRPPAAALVSS